MAKNAHVMIVGGGSGGHFYPLMSIVDGIRQTIPEVTVTYIGPEKYDEASLTERNIQFTWCPAGKWRRYISFSNFTDIFKLGFGIVIATLKLYTYYPDVVITKGGYTSVPVVIAAAFLNIPIIVHESDSVPGSANKLAARFAHSLFVAYEHMVNGFSKVRAEFIGIPIRDELLAPETAGARERIGINNNFPILLILGGSQGAEHVNELILDSLDELLPDFNIIHQTGKQHFSIIALSARELITDDTILDRYHPIAFIDAKTLNDALFAATLVISRAGSTSIHEIAVHGKPAILIPISEEVSHDQQSNAYAYARTGAAVVIEESNLTDGLLRAEIDRIMQNREAYDDMVASAKSFAKKDAKTRICETVNSIILEH